MHSPRLLHPRRLCLYGSTLLAAFQLAFASSPPGLDSPEPVGPFFNGTFPNTPPGDPSGWAVVNAFPNLTFTDPMMMSEIPGQNQFLVVGKNGMIWRFPNNPAATMAQRVTVLDYTAKTETSEDQGFYSLAFHPNFAVSGATGENQVFVCYSRRAFAGVDDNDRTYWTVSRFDWDPETQAIDPNSESILISQYDPHRYHNGGATFFGDDGFLYITAGDGGLGGDALDNSQRINVGFFGGMLRIDVDNNPAKSHPIRRPPTEDPGWEVNVKPEDWPISFSQGYGIPNTNPWQDPGGGILEEFYAIGLRSPHSAHFDPPTDEIWVGDVGEANREELTRVANGSNCQWAYKEGTRSTSKNKPVPLIGTEMPPVYEYPHTEGASIIGGMRYRGTKWNSFLADKVIFGDHVTGRIWNLELTGGAPVVSEMLSSFDTGYKKGLCGFATDSAGEIYMMNLGGASSPNGKIMKLALPAISAEPPQFLSQTGVFTNLATFATAPGVIPYDVPNPLWSDAAAKRRWVILPNDGTFNTAAEDIVFSEEGNWVFPAGTVFVKHFEVNTDANNPAAIRRLETRFLICTAGGGKYGVTYKWNEQGTDAELMEQGLDEAYSYSKGDGSVEQRMWAYPSRGDCMLCHNDASGQALGFRTSPLNSNYHYPSTNRTANQLATLNSLGAFNVTLTATQLANYIESRALNDETAPLEHRVRSYLATNCAHCHQPGGSGAGFDARLETPLDLQNLINGIPQRYEALGPDGRYIAPGDLAHSAVNVRAGAVNNGDAMPPLAKNMAHAAGVAALQDYISGLTPSQFSYLPAPKARYVRLRSLAGTRAYASVREFQILDGEGVIIPFTQLGIHDYDSQEGPSTAATKAIDGSIGTSNHWQTLNNGGTNHPHHITIDVGSLREIGGFIYYPRFNSTNGRISQYEVHLSEDGVSWTPFKAGTWPTNTTDPITYSPPYNKRPARAQIAGPTAPVEGSYDVTVVFDMDVTDFDASDLSVTGGSVTGLRGSGYYYVARISPAPGATAMTVSVPQDVVSPEGQGSFASSQLAITVLPDQQPPSTPTGLAGTPGLFSVQLTWNPSTDNNGVTGYQVWRGTTLLDTVASPGYTDNSLQVQTSYSYKVIAVDEIGNESAPAELTVTTLADEEAPSMPGSLAGTAGLFSIQLSWDPSGDNLGVTDYEIWRNGALIATVSSPGYTDNDLQIDTAYEYEVIALDAAGNDSEPAVLSIRTLEDTAVPGSPGSLAATPRLLSVELSWTAASDNVGVVEYQILRGIQLIATVSGLGYTDNDLLSNTAYQYQVIAVDAAGNLSEPASIGVSTLPDEDPPGAPLTLNGTPGLTSVQLTWQTPSDNLGVTGYEVWRNGMLLDSSVAGTGYTDNDLESETLYHYAVVAFDAAGNRSDEAEVSVTTLADEEAPGAPLALNGTPGLTSVQLTWQTPSDNLGVTGYEVWRNGTLLDSSVVGTAYTDNDLESETLYHYAVVAFDAAGNRSEEAEVSVTTLADDEAPGAPLALNGTPGLTSVQLTWQTPSDNLGVTGYEVWRDGTLLDSSVAGTGYTDNDLGSETLYHYSVVAFDAAGNRSEEAEVSVTTLADDEAPGAPLALNGTPGLTSVQLTWQTPSDNLGVTGYEVWRDGTLLDSSVAGTGYTDNDLESETPYHYAVIAFDAAGNRSEEAEVSVTTLADEEAPSTPLSLNGIPGLVSVQLTWQASTDNLGVTGYRITRGTELIATVPGTGYTDNDLESETTYDYKVTAFDAAGNESEEATLSVTTLADEEAPTIPTNLGGTPSLESIQLFWTASSDNLGVTGYEIWRDSTLIATVPGTGYADTGLTPDTAYAYEVMAVDAAGNHSDAAAASISTSADEEAPSAPGTLLGTPDFHSIVLTWGASEDNLGVTGYQILRGDEVIATVPGLSYTDSNLARGTSHTYQVKAIDAAGNVSEPATLVISTLGFEDWLDLHDLAGQTGGDSDHGGLDNLTEYHLGLDPNNPSDDLSFQITVGRSGTNLTVAFPQLVATGNYHLHASDSLDDIKTPAKRIHTVTAEQIGMMAGDDGGEAYTVEVPSPEARKFFLLIFEPTGN